jgi:uncharacterized Rmd1/YagE family protein
VIVTQERPSSKTSTKQTRKTSAKLIQNGEYAQLNLKHIKPNRHNKMKSDSTHHHKVHTTSK